MIRVLLNMAVLERQALSREFAKVDSDGDGKITPQACSETSVPCLGLLLRNQGVFCRRLTIKYRRLTVNLLW